MKKFKTVRVVEGFRDKTLSGSSSTVSGGGSIEELEDKVYSIFIKAARNYSNRYSAIDQDDVYEFARITSWHGQNGTEELPFDFSGETGVDITSTDKSWSEIWSEYFGLNDSEIEIVSEYFEKT